MVSSTAILMGGTVAIIVKGVETFTGTAL